LFDLALEPMTLSFVGASSKDDIKRARVLMAESGERWPVYWLHERGLPEWAAELDQSMPTVASIENAPVSYRNGTAHIGDMP